MSPACGERFSLQFREFLQLSASHPTSMIYCHVCRSTEGPMQVSKWGNSLAVRLPAAVVEALDLKEGDEIEISIAGKRDFKVARDRSKERGLQQLREKTRRKFISISPELLRRGPTTCWRFNSPLKCRSEPMLGRVVGHQATAAEQYNAFATPVRLSANTRILASDSVWQHKRCGRCKLVWTPPQENFKCICSAEWFRRAFPKFGFGQ